MAVARPAVAVSDIRFRVKSFGTSLLFDATNDIVTYGTTNPFTGSFYISMWIKWYGANGSFQTLFAKRDSYAEAGLVFSGSIGTNSTFNVDCTGVNFVPFAKTLPRRRWVHVMWVHDITTPNDRLYVDGLLTSTQGAVTLGTGTGALISIGACEATPTDVFNGKIDEVVIGTAAPTDAEALMIAKKSIYPSQWTHTPYDEGSGSTATDSSGGAHDGTISGATYTTDKLMAARLVASTRTQSLTRTAV